MFPGNGNREERLSSLKLAGVQYGILIVMLALVAGLWRLQVLNVENFKQLAEQNRIRQVPILAPRGKLFDRYGRLLVDNYPSVSCFLVREHNRNIEADLPLIARGLDLDLGDLEATLRHYRSEPGYQPIPIKQDISPDEQAFIAAHKNELPELETIDEERRLYPPDGFAAHLIGYTGELSENDLNTPQYAFYQPGDIVGKAGVEEAYDEVLRGEDGAREVIVDSHGREVGFLGTQHAIPGHDLRLTIDNDLQKAAELALGDREGAVVAMDPRNGEILAMVSHPSFDPNAFSVKIDRKQWDALLANPEHPLMNKAIQAQLAPGSTFKILMSVAGLEEGVAQKLHVFCNGGADFYGHFYHCDRHHGAVDIYNAIPDSCDTYFYTLANILGIGTIDKYADEFGFGQRTGIDLPDEEPGLMPSAEWVLKTFHHKWYAGETISVGIGQGAVEATPLQLARYIGGVASDGHLMRPHVVFPDELPGSSYKEILQNYPGAGDKYIPIDDQTWDIITNGMAEVTEPGEFHTAGSAHLDGIDFAGKTGTAEVMSDALIKAKGLHGPSTYSNVWFVGVVPRRNPHLVVAVLWMHGNFSYYAAHIAMRVAAAYVDKQRRMEHNLPPAQEAKQNAAPVEVGAVWSAPLPAGGNAAAEVSKIQAGHLFLYPTAGTAEAARNGAGGPSHPFRKERGMDGAHMFAGGQSHPALPVTSTTRPAEVAQARNGGLSHPFRGKAAKWMGHGALAGHGANPTLAAKTSTPRGRGTRLGAGPEEVGTMLPELGGKRP
ncbi:MAG: penicillin-binding protein 2 [Terracidiphilus sp.]